MEFPTLGKHCQQDGCHQLGNVSIVCPLYFSPSLSSSLYVVYVDFLPFKCKGCSLEFCLDHRTKPAHRCIVPDVCHLMLCQLQPTQLYHDDGACLVKY
jgi:hypothetical protein